MPKSSDSPGPALRQFFSNEKGELPGFIHAIDDFVHVKIVYLQGRLDSSTSTDMDHFFKKAKKNPAQLDKSILLDFRKVDHIDSAAVAQLFRILTLLKLKRHRLGLINVSDRVVSMLEILKLDMAFQVFESKSKALEEVQRWSREWD